ncbi:unnamed protein product [Caenorhabditis auriculariae]|uniref:Uncharacterized protein n=1 Tax=Caenorhabditis auriculariae TaxID=2777116 RepID=A0A8S1HUG7_9PELO|nr:unnamed protein product [Caenorhabditis auriculariae]
MDSGDVQSLRQNLKKIREITEAKRNICLETLSTLENYEDLAKSRARRQHVKQVLSVDFIEPPSEICPASVSLEYSHLYEDYACFALRLQNTSKDLKLVPQCSVLPSSPLVRMLVSNKCDSVAEIVDFVRPISTCQIHVAFPKELFYSSEKLVIVIDCFPLATTSAGVPADLLAFALSRTLADVVSTPFSRCVQVDFPTTSSSLRDFEYADERQAVKLMSCVRVCSSRQTLSKPIPLKDFRRFFPQFVGCDYETWQVYLGTERYSGLLAVVDIKSHSLQNFLSINKSQLISFAASISEVQNREEAAQSRIEPEEKLGIQVADANDSFDIDFY